MRRIALVLVGALAAMPLAAQSNGIDKGTVEIGIFGKYTGYPNSFHWTRSYDRAADDFGVGGRLGIFVARNLALEVDASHNNGDIIANPPTVLPTTGYPFFRDMVYIPVHLQLVYNAPLSNSLFWEFGAGGSYTHTGYPYNRKDIGVGGITGVRIRMGNHVSLRGEGTLDFVPSGYQGTSSSSSNVYFGAQVGLSLMFGGKGCDHAGDMVRIQPTSASLAPGQTQTFSSSATYCGENDQVVYRLTGPGTLDSMSGMYTATTVGSAQVTAYSHHGKMTSAAAITVAAATMAPPPPPPARTPAPVQAPPPPPAQPPAAPPHYTFDLAMVHFRFDHADLTKGGEDTVKAIVATLKAHGDVNVDLVGHTDWIGTEAYNMKLSRARAETVHRLMVSLGIADSRLTVKWRGKDEPMADNKTQAGRDMNRRVEVKQNN